MIYHMHNNFKCSFVLTITGSQKAKLIRIDFIFMVQLFP